MSKEAPLQTLSYYALVLGMVMNKPMSNEHRDLLARHVAGRLPRAVLNDLYAEPGMTEALTVMSKELSEPRMAPAQPAIVAG